MTTPTYTHRMIEYITSLRKLHVFRSQCGSPTDAENPPHYALVEDEGLRKEVADLRGELTESEKAGVEAFIGTNPEWFPDCAQDGHVSQQESVWGSADCVKCGATW